MKQFAAVLTFAAAATMSPQSFYNGQPIATTGVTLSSWGGGKIIESKESSLAGGSALRVETGNLFQGGLISTASPLNLSVAAGNKNSMLTIGIWVVDFKGAPSGGGGGGRGPGRPVGGEGGTRGGGGVAVGGGAPVGGGGASSTSAPVHMSRVRMVIKTSDGMLSEAILPVSGPGKWVKVGVPVSMIPGFSKTNKQISSIAVAGDAPAFFYVGEINVADDTTPIQGYITSQDMNIGRGTEVVLSGSAEGGSSPLEFIWDFNDKDGLQAESMGAAIRHKFRIPGEYKVTLTIRDIYGLKLPWVGTINVTVNP